MSQCRYSRGWCAGFSLVPSSSVELPISVNAVNPVCGVNRECPVVNAVPRPVPSLVPEPRIENGWFLSPTANPRWGRGGGVWKMMGVTKQNGGDRSALTHHLRIHI